MNDKLLLEKKLNRWAWVISIVVFLVVAMMGNPMFRIQTTIDFSFLPVFHSTMNAITAVLLIAALYFIKNKNKTRHQQMIYIAMGTSALFLASYVTYHLTTPAVKFGGEGTIRIVYFTLLISHIVLAAVGMPFILLTFIRAFTGQFERHKRMARWVWWIWFYIASTGPICYLMLRPYYK
jgi:putative membrane protein